MPHPVYKNGNNKGTNIKQGVVAPGNLHFTFTLLDQEHRTEQ